MAEHNETNSSSYANRVISSSLVWNSGTDGQNENVCDMPTFILTRKQGKGELWVTKAYTQPLLIPSDMSIGAA